jgi:6,7-dimethyl-8-ribityllumazine synthase
MAVIIARFNDLVTGKLLSGCLDCLCRHGIDTTATSAQLDVGWVPRAGIRSNLGWNYGLQALEMGSLMAALPG